MSIFTVVSIFIAGLLLDGVVIMCVIGIISLGVKLVDWFLD